MSKPGSFAIITSSEFPDEAFMIRNPNAPADDLKPYERWLLALARERDEAKAKLDATCSPESFNDLIKQRDILIRERDTARRALRDFTADLETRIQVGAAIHQPPSDVRKPDSKTPILDACPKTWVGDGVGYVPMSIAMEIETKLTTLQKECVDLEKNSKRYAALRNLALLDGTLEYWVARKEIDYATASSYIDDMVDELVDEEANRLKSKE